MMISKKRRPERPESIIARYTDTRDMPRTLMGMAIVHGGRRWTLIVHATDNILCDLAIVWELAGSRTPEQPYLVICTSGDDRNIISANPASPAEVAKILVAAEAEGLEITGRLPRV